MKRIDILKRPESELKRSGSVFFSKGTADLYMGTKKEQPPTLVGIVQSRDYCFGDAPEDALQLDCGRSLRGVNIRYETYGTLNADKSNAILVEHALTGDAHLAGFHSETDRRCPPAAPTSL